MRSLLTLMLAAAMLPDLSQANICDRTPQVRDEILRQLRMVSNHCGIVSAERLARIHTLRFYNERLTLLRAGDFDGLNRLGTLDLSHNRLTGVFLAGVFDGLTGLHTLDLSYNRFRLLPADLFDGLTGLRRLDMAGNQLTTLPADLFDGIQAENSQGIITVSLQRLSLHNNQLTALPDGVFDYLHQLQALDLSHNRLTALPDGIFDGLTDVYFHELDLRYNHLVGLTRNDPLFAGLDSRVRVRLDGQTDPQEEPEPSETVNICDRTPQVRDEILRQLGASDCAAVDSERLASVVRLTLHVRGLTLQAGDFDGLTSLQHLWLADDQLTALPAGVFDSLTSLQTLALHGRLTALPDGLFDGLTSLQELNLGDNRLTALPAGVFDDLRNLQQLHLSFNQLTALPDGLFDSLISLQILDLQRNRLTALPEGVFDRLTRLQSLLLGGNQLTALPEGVFAGLSSLRYLHLNHNQLTILPAGVFAGLSRFLRYLYLNNNLLTELPEGVFDGLRNLRQLHLNHNQLTSLPEGVFAGLTGLRELYLNNNHLVGLTNLDLERYARLPRGLVRWDIDGQTEPPERLEEPEANAQRLAAAVPLMVSASDSMRMGFVRIINESEESGSVRILAVDDGGNAASPIEIQLGASQSLHFNSNDLEDGNARKGINTGVGSPMRGDWRLDVETALNMRVLSFARTTDGFLTAMGDVLQRNAEGRLMAQTFNPGSNANQLSKLRLVNTGANAERVSIDGVDDQGERGGPVTLTLAAGESRTLSAFDLENGAQGLTGTLGDGAGKWRLFITAGQAVKGMSLLEAVSGHLTNISAMGVATEDQ